MQKKQMIQVMKKHLFTLCLIFIAGTSYAGENDSLYLSLSKRIDNRSLYVQQKEQIILNLKQLLTFDKLPLRQIYDFNTQLYEEYKKYQSDSAVHYLLKNKEIANQLGIEELLQETQLKLAYLYSVRGMYIEAQDILKNIDKNKLSASLLPAYYDACSTFYNYYELSTNSYQYSKSEQYRDSLLLTLDKQTLQYRIARAAQLLYTNQPVESYLLSLLDDTSDKNTERGLIAYYLGYMYRLEAKTDLSEKYYIISAIADVENSIKENASFRALATIYFEAGDIDKAHKFMQLAVDDAVFCNVRFRMNEMSTAYPVISAAYQAKEKRQKHNLQISLVVISILLLSLAAGILYIYRQFKRLSVMRKELYRTNLQLSRLNDDLTVTNNQLQESNHIKEEYIAHFFDLCSAYIDKLENYRKMLNKYASNRQIDELVNSLRSSDFIENEREELYKKFDVIFLNLYPTFVEEFNAMQIPEEQITLRRGELLNTELRIFALIRLGITDSMKIAGFLRYSISTIYNYRVKARNNAIIPREQFEEAVMKIGNDRARQT
ncbi:MAG: DUF6377 domain-containing protein [Dysgonamonadaceae bacterium]|nr:DUF6377 domain-containing protein [Dysgonamonadaceae bacterium]